MYYDFAIEKKFKLEYKIHRWEKIFIIKRKKVIREHVIH